MSKINLIPFIIFCVSFFFNASAQEYSYKHYGIREGLVGNHVYHAVKDKTGFLWFATETGVSRFDGTNFKNFTTAEGLPDNEILKMFVDREGRVWMMPFNKAICYYEKGKIHSSDNDSILGKLRLDHYVQNIFQDHAGNLIFIAGAIIHILKPDGSSYATKEVSVNLALVAAGGFNELGNLVIHTDSSCYELKIGRGTGYILEPVDYGFRFWATKLAYFYLDPRLSIYIDNYRNLFAEEKVIITKYRSSISDTLIIESSYNQVSFYNDSFD